MLHEPGGVLLEVKPTHPYTKKCIYEERHGINGDSRATVESRTVSSTD